MRAGNSYLKTKDRPQFWWDAVLGYCFVFIFSFSFVFGQTPALPNSPGEACEVRDNSSHLSDAGFIIGDHQPIHIPADADPTLPESEVPDESESSDHGDDITGKLFCSLPNTNLDLHSGKCPFSQHRLSIESRSRIALFILHHSWKSFLS